MTWEEYCKKKKIDSALFQKAEPAKWQEWSTLFEQVHPNSFTEQKKFLINDIRRKYQLKEVIKVEEKKVESTESNTTISPTTTPVAKKPGGVKIPPRKPS